MEYIIVKAKQNVDVIINGQKNGKTNQQMELGEGFVLVSIDMSGAETKEIDLMGTTSTQPMEIEILCEV